MQKPRPKRQEFERSEQLEVIDSERGFWARVLRSTRYSCWSPGRGREDRSPPVWEWLVSLTRLIEAFARLIKKTLPYFCKSRAPVRVASASVALCANE